MRHSSVPSTDFNDPAANRVPSTPDRDPMPLSQAAPKYTGTLVVSAGCELALYEFPSHTDGEIVHTTPSAAFELLGLLCNKVAAYYWEKKTQILYSLASSLVLSIPVNRLASGIAHALGASDTASFSCGALAGTTAWYLGFYGGRSIEQRVHDLKESGLNLYERLRQATFGSVEGLGLLAYATHRLIHFGVTTIALESAWFFSMVGAESRVAS